MNLFSKFSILGLILTTTSFTHAYECDFGIEYSIDVGVGFRQDELHWDQLLTPTEFGDPEPEVITKSKWEDLDIWEISVLSDVLFFDHFYARGKASFGRVVGGHNETDLADIFTSLPVTSIEGKAYGSKVHDFNVAVGYLFDICHDRIGFTPLFGYSRNVQDLRTCNTKFDDSPEDDNLFDHAHFDYKSKWRGPWVGLDLYFWPTNDLRLFGAFEYHWGKIKATGSSDIVLFEEVVVDEDVLAQHLTSTEDFTQRAGYTGIYLSGGFKYTFCCNWIWGVNAEYRRLSSRSTRSPSVLVSNGLIEIEVPILDQPKIRWHSYSVMTTIGFAF